MNSSRFRSFCETYSGFTVYRWRVILIWSSSELAGLAVRQVPCFDYELSQRGTDLAGRVLLQEVPAFDGHFLLIFPAPAEPLVCAARRDNRSGFACDEQFRNLT